MVYSHRNKERQHPTERGYYWCFIWRTDSWVIDYHRGIGMEGGWDIGFGYQADLFSGPIVPPNKEQ